MGVIFSEPIDYCGQVCICCNTPSTIKIKSMSGDDIQTTGNSYKLENIGIYQNITDNNNNEYVLTNLQTSLLDSLLCDNVTQGPFTLEIDNDFKYDVDIIL